MYGPRTLQFKGHILVFLINIKKKKKSNTACYLNLQRLVL